MGKKLYVGNLPYSVDDAALQNRFGEFGAVTSAKVIMDRDSGRSKGFGFVEMQEGGDKAIAEMNGKDFNGRALTVNEARPMASRASGRVSFKQH